MIDKDLHDLRNKMQGAQNLVSLTRRYFNSSVEEKEKLRPLIMAVLPQADYSMDYLRNFRPTKQ